MFERFTDRARRVLVLAQDEAKALEHNFLGTEHVLLGLIKEGEGVGAKALRELGTDYDTLRAKITSVITPGAPGTASGAPPFTPRSKKVLELALAEALELGHNYIGTEHVLLGLIREGSGVAAQALVAEGLALPTVRAKVIELLAGYQKTHNPMGRQTPAATSLEARVKAAASVNPVGSQHYLLALLEDPACLAARVLASLGVTLDAVRARVREIGVAGSSDEMPTVEAGQAKPFRFDLGPNITLHVADAEVAKSLAVALAEVGRRGAAGTDLAAVIGSLVADAVTAPEAPAGGEDVPPEEDAAPPAPE